MLDELIKKFGWSTKQLQVLTCPDCAHLMCVGAARGGKTFCTILRFIFKLIDVEKYGDDCAIICKTYDTFQRNFLSPLGKILDSRYFSYSPYKKILTMFGIKCWVISANDKTFDDKIKGGTFSALYVDELTTLPEQRWWLANTRMAKEYSMIISTSNPDVPLHYAKTDILDKEINNPDFKHFHFTLDDNPSLTARDKEKFKKKFHGAMYDRYILGKWVMNTGRVYNLEEKEHILQESAIIPAPTKYFIGVDFGTANPFCAVLFGENANYSPRVIAWDEIFYASRETEEQRSSMQYAHMIDQKWGHLPIDAIYIDPSATRFFHVMSTFNYRVRRANNDVMPGIQLVQDMMHEGSYKIKSNCRRLIDSKNSYSWDTSSTRNCNVDKPLKRFDDAVDAERYGLFSRYGIRGYKDKVEETPFRHGLIHNETIKELDYAYNSSARSNSYYRL